jgi:hypothetical protein
MFTPVVLKNGKDLTVNKDQLNFLLATQQIMFFKRQDGWVVVGRDDLRDKTVPYQGIERRNHEVYSKHYWS